LSQRRQSDHIQRMTQTPEAQLRPGLHVVKRYAGTRLYNTSTMSYVTVDQLRRLLRTDAEVAIYDAKSGADITHLVLTLN
jgi:polyhydroxyalkanoate synthesis regulator protein